MFRKKTAVEKAQKQRKKERKKELKAQKKAERKDARQEKKETRKEARQEKKDIRKSDMSRKEKKQAKKEVRKEKRNDIKEIKASKKDNIKDIKAELKEVRQDLKIILPKKSANVALLRADLRDIPAKVGEYNCNGNIPSIPPVTIDDAFAIINDAYHRAKEMTSSGLNYMENIINSNRNQWISSWNNDQILPIWFGIIDKPNQANKVYKRLKSVDDRLNKKIKIRLHPQRDASVNAQNNGTFFEPKTFKIFPRLIISAMDCSGNIDIDKIASVMIHELIHLWFKDQKLSSGEKVYGDTNARQLATENPRKARKSAENYEHYSLNF